MDKLNRAQKCSILGPQNLGSRGGPHLTDEPYNHLYCKFKQECIPVGCLPAAHWLYAAVCFPGWGLSASRGGGGVSLPGGSSLPRGSPCPGGPPYPGGSPCPETPPVNRITDTCKNITLATTSLRPVITLEIWLCIRIHVAGKYFQFIYIRIIQKWQLSCISGKK